jgi:hypothetical protein
MAAWIQIFCTRSLAEVTPDQILAGIDAADWWTIAEYNGIDDEAIVDAALKYLKITSPRHQEAGKHRLRLFYRPARLRQVEIERWTDAALVADEVKEARESLARVRNLGAVKVRELLPRVLETVGIELGWDQLDGDMAAVLAYEVARWLAHTGKGILRDHNGTWWGVTRGGALRLWVSNATSGRQRRRNP